MWRADMLHGSTTGKGVRVCAKLVLVLLLEFLM
jgi:hypothetical protein